MKDYIHSMFQIYETPQALNPARSNFWNTSLPPTFIWS